MAREWAMSVSQFGPWQGFPWAWRFPDVETGELPTCVPIVNSNVKGRVGLGNAISRTIEMASAALLWRGLSVCNASIVEAVDTLCWEHVHGAALPWDLARHFDWPIPACPKTETPHPHHSGQLGQCEFLPSHIFLHSFSRGHSWLLSLNASAFAQLVHYDPKRRDYQDRQHHCITRTCTARRWFGAVSPEIAKIAATVTDRVEARDRVLAVHYRAGDAVVAPHWNALDRRSNMNITDAAEVVKWAADLFQPTIPSPGQGQLLVFVTADDAKFIATLKAHLMPHHKLLHLVHGFRTIENQTTDADMHAIADWHLLTRSDALLMLSKSTFSTSAAQFGMAQCSVPLSKHACMHQDDWKSGEHSLFDTQTLLHDNVSVSSPWTPRSGSVG